MKIVRNEAELINAPKREDNYAMQHWNNKMMAVMDTETTGLDPSFHEMVQFCCIALDANFNPLKGVIPFYVNLKPNFPERVDPKALEINKLDMAKIMVEGFDRDKAVDMFVEWYRKLGIRGNAYGNPNKIMPLGQNYQFDMAFIQSWMGVELYRELFDYHYRDTMSSALYINDRAGMKAEKIPFPKVNLQYLATTLGVKTERAHDALSDCLVTAEVYKKLCQAGSVLG